MKLIRWFFSLFFRRKKAYSIELPIGFQKNEKHKRMALFGEPLHSKKGT